jgi:ATP-dependent helicase/nuclease subunit A
MTVHAAKGLEAPVVFLPDTLSPPGGRHDPKLFWPEPFQGEGGGEGEETPVLILPGGQGDDTPLSEAARAAARRARMQEYRRLLYVATTRPRDRLYVCGWADRVPKDPAKAASEAAAARESNWHALLDAALRGRPGVREVDLPWGGPRALRLGPADDAGVAATAMALPAVPAPAMPGWATAPAPAEPPPAAPLSPSALGADPARAAGTPDGAAAAARRGTTLHLLFETLPKIEAGARAALGQRIVAREMPELAPDAQAALLTEALAVLQAFPALFGPEARAEVPVIGRFGGREISGQIDRLIIRPGEILIVDFKSNRAPPAALDDVPPAYVAQLALYRALLAPLYPGRPVACRLVWTATATGTDLPSPLLDVALSGLTQGSDPLTPA